MILQKKELELPESEKTAREKKPSSEKPRVVRNFNQKKPVADGMRSKVATLSHDVLAGVSLSCLSILHECTSKWTAFCRLLYFLHLRWPNIALRVYLGRFLARNERTDEESMYYLGREDYDTKRGRNDLSLIRLLIKHYRMRDFEQNFGIQLRHDKEQHHIQWGRLQYSHQLVWCICVHKLHMWPETKRIRKHCFMVKHCTFTLQLRNLFWILLKCFANSILIA